MMIRLALFASLIGVFTTSTFAQPPEPPLDVPGVVEEHVMVPMRDGVKLSVYLYIPTGDGPWPGLLEQRYANGRALGTRKELAQLAAKGYIVALQNFRGSQKSEGTWVGYRALGWGELKDGYDTVEWLAKHPKCTGKIGTFGSSQAGFAQNFLAVTQPPHLVCQYMIDTGLSLYHEGYRIGGTTRPQRFIKMGEVCRVPEHNRALMDEWFAHPTFDAYWAAEDCSQHFDKMNVPCFTVGSWYDFMSVGSIDSYVGRQHHGGPHSRGKQQLYIGPWLHGRFNKQAKVNEVTYPDNASFDMLTHMGKWFDHHLKGIDNGVDRDPAVRYYVMGAVGEPGAPGNEWRSAKDWPIPSQPTPYFLHADGKLNTEKPTADRSETAWTSDPLHPAEIPNTAGFPGAKDARPFESQKNVLTFTTEPLTAPVEWTGKVQTEIFLTSTAKDTDVIVRVSDVYPDGQSILIIDYVRRARYRDGFEKEVSLEPGKVEKVAFDVGSLSQIFAKGHRIRVTLASTGAPFYEPNPQTGKPLTIDFPADAVVATNKVRHDKEFSSRVIAPVVGTAR